MIDEKADAIEKEFLSILYFKQEIALELLQIKPKYLQNKVNQEIFAVMLESQKKLNVIDNSYILEHLENIPLEKFTEIVCDENLPITDIRVHFGSAQSIILDNYKKKVISNLTLQLNSKKLTCDEYLNKMNKIDNIRIQNVSHPLTLEELNSGLTKGKQIDLSSYRRLNNLMKLLETDLLVVGGHTGTGKSSFLINLMINLMEKYHCIYLNMEVGKPALYSRFISIKAHVPIIDILKPNTEYQASLINQAKQDLIKNNLYVETRPFTLSEIENYIKLMKSENGKHTIVFVDHIGLITNDSKVKMSLYEQTTANVKALRQMCIKYNVTIIAACQLNRTSANTRKLNVSSLRDSGEIEQSACKILLLSMQEGYDKSCLEPVMILDLCKNRDGMTGDVEFIYTKVNQIFKEREYHDA